MKRSASSHPPPIMKAAMIRLNVGGQVFATSKETLLKCGYFEPVLSGRIPHGEDDQGALFLDRSPELFKHILQYLRAGTVPSRKELWRFKHGLLAECLYYGVPGLADYLRGQISPLEMRAEDRKIRLLEGDQALVDLYSSTHFDLREPQDLQVTVLPCSAPRARMKGSFEDFQRRMAESTCGLSESLKDIGELVFAGGSVTGAVCGCPIGDVDIFLLGDLIGARDIMERVYTSVAARHKKNFGQGGRVLVTRSRNAVTLFQVAPDRAGPPPIQVVLSVQSDIKELLHGFDVDSCCFCYSPKEQKVWTNQRGLRALAFGANLADSRYDGPGYVRRL